MQYVILTSSILSSFLFFVLHLLLLRVMTAEKIMRVLPLAFVIAGIVQGVALTLYLWPPDSYSFFLSVFVSTILYGGLVFYYVLSILGITLTSVRIQMLLEIARTGGNGLTYERLLQQYNREAIVTSSLQRLVGAGELEKKVQFYHVGKRRSFFRFYSKIIIFMLRLYGREKRQ